MRGAAAAYLSAVLSVPTARLVLAAVPERLSVLSEGVVGRLWGSS